MKRIIRILLRTKQAAISPSATTFESASPATGPKRISKRTKGLASVLPRLNPISVERTSRICKYTKMATHLRSSTFTPASLARHGFYVYSNYVEGRTLMSRLYTLFAFPFLAALAAAQTPCDQLKLTFPDAKIMSIEFVPSGPFAAPTGTLTPVIPGPAPAASAAAKGAPAGRGGRGPAGPAASVPAYCRVLMVMTPSSDSLIDTAVFLPTENWNGKLQVVGNGGWAGSVSYPAMAAALREGYAVASNDTGHRANDAGGGGMFGLGHPEKITDFAYRAMHETVVKAKAITVAFYGKGPKYSYYNGCSTGGRQGLIEITKFPEDFDAATVGAPANPHVHLHAAGVERSLELMKNNAPLTQAKVETLHKAVMDSCDALDGVKDG